MRLREAGIKGNGILAVPLVPIGCRELPLVLLLLLQPLEPLLQPLLPLVLLQPLQPMQPLLPLALIAHGLSSTSNLET